MGSSSGAHAMSLSSLPLVGREQEIGALQHLLRSAIDGSGRLVLASGEAGIGKTSLVRQLRTMAAETDALVLTGGAYDLTSTPPYGPWLELIRNYPEDSDLPPLPEFLSSPDSVAAPGSQAELHRAMLAFFQNIGRIRPVVLILEDLHWSDQPSLELLRMIARLIEDEPILLVVTWRDDEITRQHPLYQLLPALVRETNAERLELRQLNETDIGELVQARYALSEDEHQMLVRYLLRLGDGNPLFTVELLRTLERQGDLHQEDRGWRIVNLSDERVPGLIQQMIERRTSELSQQTFGSLQIAATLGQSFSLERWERVAGESVSEFAEESLETHFIEESSSGRGVEFPHALIRQAIYATISLPRRRELHAKVADVYLADPNPDPDVIAWHLTQAGDLRAAEWLIRAGEQAEQRFAKNEAFARYSDALEAVDRVPGGEPSRVAVLVKMGRSLVIDPVRSNEYLRTAYETARDSGKQAFAAVALFYHGKNLVNLGEVQRGLNYVQQAIAMTREIPDDVAETLRWVHHQPEPRNPLYEMTSSLALYMASTGRFQESVTIAEQLIGFDWRMLAGHGEHTREARKGFPEEDVDDFYELGINVNWLCGLGIALGALGETEDSKLAFSLADTMLSERDDLPVRVIVANTQLPSHHFPYNTDNLAERTRLAEQFEEHAQISQDLHDLTLFGYEHYLLYSGKWQQLRELIEKYEPTSMFDLWFASLCARARLAWYEGDTEHARTLIAELLTDGPHTSPDDQAFVLPAEPHRIAAGIAIDAGDIDMAREWMVGHDHWLDWSESVHGRATGLLLWSRIHLADNDPDRAQELAEQARQHAECPRQPMALIAIHRFLGELATRRGDLDTASEHLRQSLELAEACALPFERALTLLAQAELELSRDNPGNASSLLTEAQEIATQLDAPPILERLDRLVAKLGQRRVVDPSGLSSRELEVLALLTQGKSNKEIADELFIARSTVMHHVASILRKLDLDSRSAAAAEAVRRKLV